jgi:phosphonate metabolism protein PhnN/1,5-bisphosphokinase (PRPP-forming)
MSGFWVFVCGPSGAGKDSVLNWASAHLRDQADIIFARRLITRAKHAGSDHDPVTADQFAHLAQTSGLAWQWQAHGFDYGISDNYSSDVAAGRVVVLNGSRQHGCRLQGSQKIRVVQITTDAQRLAERLVQRGRDAPNEVNQRLARNARFSDWQADYTIVNQGELSIAGLELAKLLVSFAIS